MIPVREALDRLYCLVEPARSETLPLEMAAGLVLAAPVTAVRDQPPVPVSAMDGYAVRSSDLETCDSLVVTGEIRAGGKEDLPRLEPGQAVRIFTGAPLPCGADRVIIQEQVRVIQNRIVPDDDLLPTLFVRNAGSDFRRGFIVDAPRILTPADVSVIAAMNVAKVKVSCKPVVSIIPTGDELRMPGERLEDHEIVASNIYGLQAMLRACGCDAGLLPIAGDSLQDISSMIRMARGSDLIVTIGGASVGEFDMVLEAATSLGFELAFQKVNMRPGKPTLAGRLGTSILVGLPGNPVSALVGGMVFIRPLVLAMQGLRGAELLRQVAPLAEDIDANGAREHYARASLLGGSPNARLKLHDRQDSSLLTVLQKADALAVRPPNDPARKAGELVEFLPLAGIIK